MQLIQSYGDKNIVLNIETKSYPDPASAGYKNNADPKKFVEVFNNIVKKYDMEDRVVLQSFDWQTLIEMKKLNPNISTSALLVHFGKNNHHGDVIVNLYVVMKRKNLHGLVV
ncbi:hypothetical protein [Megamonas funiformis]|uniref:hypothetical protein n=1 Tax=Megamonas funiformis TaxID=437897 RepID=UPI003AF8546B